MELPRFRCRKGERWLLVQNHPTLAGIDYLEVSLDQHTLYVYFIPKKTGDAIPAGLTGDSIRITIGTADSGIQVKGEPKKDGNLLTVTVDDGQTNPERTGDFSTYTLNIVGVADLDPYFSKIDFTFKVNCPRTLDCKPDPACFLPHVPSPRIDYLSRDYASFRRLMLDRLSLVLPGWKEQSPADVMMAIVEVLAYAGDHLSYYQDAVSTETYLGTARRRVSVRRHARLLDYHMHDGCNARTWVQVWWEGCDEFRLEGPSKPTDPIQHGGTKLLTQAGSMPVRIPQSRLEEALAENPIVFETMQTITLYEAHREIAFYTWGETNCCLPRGATGATLDGTYPGLRRGDVLIIEEITSPENGGPPDPAHRHAVRLTKVVVTSEDGTTPLKDQLTGRTITEIEWDESDVLPFPLCISIRGKMDVPDNDRISVARGNIVLADYGLTIPSQTNAYQDLPLEDIGTVPLEGDYTPVLRYSPLTQQGFIRPAGSEDLQQFDENSPACAALQWEMRDVYPAVLLKDRKTGALWKPVLDLLASDRFSREFVVEVEEDGTAWIRFGDDVTGLRPAASHQFDAMYRIGNGTAGNIGHDAIVHVVLPDSLCVPAGPAGEDFKTVRNLLPASGGTDPESTGTVKLDAPQAFRTQERAVTPDDYAMMAGRHPEVQKAVATRRWTGSWYTIFVAVDRRQGKPVDDKFKKAMIQFLEKYRLAGHDLEIVAPLFVPLDIKLKVCVPADYIATDVEKQLKAVFSSHTLPDGTRGFFHPDNFTFGQSVYLSTIVAAAMKVPGVNRVQALVMKRWDEPPGRPYKEKIDIRPYEIARLDNDPSSIQNGRIVFTMVGGL